MDAWKYPIEEVLKILHTDVNGINKDEAQRRQKLYGKNIIYVGKTKTLWQIILNQLVNPMNGLLLVAFIITLILNELLDALLIAVIVIINTILGSYQEYTAERALSSLRKYVPQWVTVIRDGEKVKIRSEELVPGDIVIISEGDRVPADIRLIESVDLSVDESPLTGESIPVKKDAKWVGDGKIFELKNMLFAGSRVIRGFGKGVVVKTGRETFIGSIAKTSTEIVKENPFDKSIKELTNKLSWITIIIALVVTALNILKGNLLVALLLGVSLAVAAIPEGLPIVVTMALAHGVKNMAESGVIVRNSKAIEALGELDVLCVDKTGTITVGEMKVVEIWGDEDQIRYVAQCCKGEKPDPLERALIDYFGEGRCKILEVIPFSSEKKWMKVVVEDGGRRIHLIKGAPEAVYEFTRNTVCLKVAEEMASRGLKTIAFAVGDGIKYECVGVVGLLDPPREGVKKAIEDAKQLGIKTIMITGDHPKTAEYVAKMVGIEGKTIVGNDIEAMKEEELMKVIDNVGVIARVTPFQKLKIVRTLKKKGYTVAMTGDGVNDALALKEAHIGIVPASSTDVAKDVADIVMTHNRYEIIVRGIKIGRNIVWNIRTFLRYLLPTNIGEVVGVFLGSIYGYIILKPAHLLLLNVVTDGLPALSLATDNLHRKGKTHIIRGVIEESVKFGIVMGVIAFLIYTITQSWAATFMFFVLSELTRIKQARGTLFGNSFLLLSIAVSFLVSSFFIYMGVLEFEPLNAFHWTTILLGTLSVFITSKIMFG